MTDKPGSWLELMRPHIRRFELAAALGLEATYNATGCGAMASLITKMATIIDNEIERRQHEEHDHGKQ